jgi:D-alanine--poly(phosphoribitol) ligase subunit 2
MTNDKNVAIEVAAILAQKLHIEVPRDDFDLFESGVLDSLSLVELLFQLEHEFGVRILLGEMDLDNFRTIERITLMLTNPNGKSSENLSWEPSTSADR